MAVLNREPSRFKFYEYFLQRQQTDAAGIDLHVAVLNRFAGQVGKIYQSAATIFTGLLREVDRDASWSDGVL